MTGLGMPALALVMLVLFPAAMAFAAAFDLTTMTIPNRLNLAVLILFAVAAALLGLPPVEVGMRLLTGAVVLGGAFALFASGMIGGGDAKLAAATALWFGLDGIVDYLALASILGGGLTLAILAARSYPLPPVAARVGWIARLHERDTGVPYGIALAAAALALFPGTPLFGLAFAG